MLPGSLLRCNKRRRFGHSYRGHGLLLSHAGYHVPRRVLKAATALMVVIQVRWSCRRGCFSIVLSGKIQPLQVWLFASCGRCRLVISGAVASMMCWQFLFLELTAQLVLWGCWVLLLWFRGGLQFWFRLVEHSDIFLHIPLRMHLNPLFEVPIAWFKSHLPLHKLLRPITRHPIWWQMIVMVKSSWRWRMLMLIGVELITALKRSQIPQICAI